MLMANWRKGLLVMGCSDKACMTTGSLDNKNNKHKIEDGRPSAGSRVERNEGGESSDNASAHSRNYERLVEQVRMIGNLLATLESAEVARLLATKEPWDGLQEALKNALELVESCKDKSYLYMLAMGWSVVNQFRHVQTQIDHHLQLMPLISAVHDFCTQLNLNDDIKERSKIIKQHEDNLKLINSQSNKFTESVFDLQGF